MNTSNIGYKECLAMFDTHSYPLETIKESNVEKGFTSDDRIPLPDGKQLYACYFDLKHYRCKRIKVVFRLVRLNNGQIAYQVWPLERRNAFEFEAYFKKMTEAEMKKMERPCLLFGKNLL